MHYNPWTWLLEIQKEVNRDGDQSPLDIYLIVDYAFVLSVSLERSWDRSPVQHPLAVEQPIRYAFGIEKPNSQVTQQVQRHFQQLVINPLHCSLS